MHRLQLLACASLTLVLLATGAPTSSSTWALQQQQLEHLLLDLQLLQRNVEVRSLSHIASTGNVSTGLLSEITICCAFSELQIPQDVHI